MAVVKEVAKIAKKDKKKRGTSPIDAVNVDADDVIMVRKKGDASIPRKEFTAFEGIEIKNQVKYLGMNICTSIQDTIKAVTLQVQKYSSYVRAKCCTGDKGLDKTAST